MALDEEEFSDQNQKETEMENFKFKIEQWKKTQSYFNYLSQKQRAEYNSALQNRLIPRFLQKLKKSKLPDYTLMNIFEIIDENIKSENQVIELFALLEGDVTIIGMALFHHSKPIRNLAVRLFSKFESFIPNFPSSINVFLKLQYCALLETDRILEERLLLK